MTKEYVQGSYDQEFTKEEENDMIREFDSNPVLGKERESTYPSLGQWVSSGLRNERGQIERAARKAKGGGSEKKVKKGKKGMDMNFGVKDLMSMRNPFEGGPSPHSKRRKGGNGGFNFVDYMNDSPF